jgi:hypothetical protein
MFDFESLFWTNIASIIAIFGIFGLWYQIKKSKDIKKGLLISELNTTFSESHAIQEIYRKLILSKENSNDIFDKNDIPYILVYFNFFVVLNNLADSKILSFKTIDRLFALRFFLIINNPYMQTYLMEQYEHDQELIRLYEKWVKHRRNNKRSEPYKENSLLIVLGRKKYPPQ